MLTTRTARWTAVTGVVCVLVLVATWFVLVSPRRSEATDLADQQLAAESQNVVLQGRIRELTKQYGDLPAKRKQLKEIRRQMPPAADVANLVRDVTEAAEDAGVTITMLTPSSPNVLAPASGTTPGVVSIGFTIQAEGEYVAAALFIKYLQSMDRRYLITEVSAALGGEGSDTPITGATEAGSTVGSSPSPSPSSTASATASATATTGVTVTTTPTRAADGLFTVKISGEVFSLVDEAGQAAAGATPAPGATPSPGAAATPTTAPTTAPTTSPTAVPGA
jgi:Tfp pilus assembly protein PilO